MNIHKLLLTLVAGGVMVRTASALITIDTVPVGNPSNVNDPTTGFGAVSYEYRIGKYEVTLSEYAAFLNAVSATDTYGLYYPSMGTDQHVRGISRSGAPGSYVYSVIGSGNRPVTYVCWFDAARFVNWLHNGQPIGPQGDETTETGAYTLNGATNGVSFARNTKATYALPSEHEWYKAAFYQPADQGGDIDNYWLYPTAKNTIPNSRNGSLSDENSANFYRNDSIDNGFNGGYAVNNSTTMPTGNVLTDVGAFSLARSFYGTFDQGGNVWEWNNAVIGLERGLRGSSFYVNANNLTASYRFSDTPANESGNVGFRVVLLPVLNFFQSGNMLTFSWVGDFKLQAQTNGLTLGIGTNWSDFPSGVNSPASVAINPENPAVFFRLSVP